jgi:hypothetical protein
MRQCAVRHLVHKFWESEVGSPSAALLFNSCRYCCYLYFQLKTHKEVASAAEGEDNHEGGEVNFSASLTVPLTGRIT